MFNLSTSSAFLCATTKGTVAKLAHLRLHRHCPQGNFVKGFCLGGASNPSLSCLADVLLVVSPAVPPCCYGQVLAVCERRGFGLEGLQRQRLQSKRATLLGLAREQVNVNPVPL